MWNGDVWQRLSRQIEQLEESMIALQAELTRRPALGPTNGGEGEREKCEYLKGYLSAWGFRLKEFRAPDERVPCGYRPSLIALMPGRYHSPKVWIMTHMDVVPSGPRELWATDPFQLAIRDGRLYGRGVEDNQQEMVASIHALLALRELGLTPEYDTGLVLVADEETGSQYGIDFVLKQERSFAPEDIIIVPDAGNETGSDIEVAEKSICWLKFVVKGRQAHASRPGSGKNAHRIGAQLLLHIDRLLHDRYPVFNPHFIPPESTFEPTKKENNVPNINTIPGEDVFYFDCRLLPEYSVQELVSLVTAETVRMAAEAGVEILVTTEQCEQAAPPTPPDAPAVRMLSRSLNEVLGVDVRTIGIGGGTVAAFFRRAGLPAAVWGRACGQAHQPNEFCLISNMVGNCKVYAYLLGLRHPAILDTDSIPVN